MSTSSSIAASRGPGRSDVAAGPPQDRIESLLGRCALREERALEELYRAVSGQLLAVLLRILRSRALAEEALQDVMVRIWQRADQYVAYRGRPMAWLISIARYRAIDLLRAQRVHDTLDEAPEAMLADASTENAEPLASERLQRNLNDCLSRLSRQQQRCISLAYIDGYSQDEIARSIGTPLGTVKSWVRRGLLSLKRCLES